MSTQEEPTILAIETATRAGSVALLHGPRVLAEARGNSAESHSISLLETIESILQQARVKLSDIDLFAVACGPGSFTGLRIGIATVKAFAVCTGGKCAGVSTLAAIAQAAGSSPHTIALLPAGRGELFAQLFAVGESWVRPLDKAAHLRPATVMEKYSELGKAILAGEGAHLYSKEFLASVNRDRSFDDSDYDLEGQDSRPPPVGTQRVWTLAPLCDQLAGPVGVLALNDYLKGIRIEPEALHASYVRPSDAEINEKWQSEKLSQPAQP